MAVTENGGVKVNCSDQNSDNNTASLTETKPPRHDDQNPNSNSSVETPNPTKDSIKKTSEVNLKSEISHLNPMAKEFFPSSVARIHTEFLRNGLWYTNNLAMQVISDEEIGHFGTRVCININKNILIFYVMDLLC